MPLTLRIENHDRLPDGGPVCITIQGQRGIDIGRDQYLDWTLPDPNRVISGKHCEIRWQDNAYWLHDTSTNGTFLIGAETRLPVPYRISNGERFVIGHYIISASIEGEAAIGNPAAASSSKLSYDEIWSAVGEVAPPINSKQLKPHRSPQSMNADFLDWAVDVPSSYIPTSSSSPSRSEPLAKAAFDDMGWAQGARRESRSEPVVVPVPEPRRPVWTTEEPAFPSSGSTPPGIKPAIPTDAASSPAEIVAAMGAGSHARTASEECLPHEPGSVPRANLRNPVVDEFVQFFSRGAGLPEDALTGCDPARLAEEVGQLLGVLVENTQQLLEGRQQAKRLAHSSDQTAIRALNNNPLKFAPTAEEAMRVMFGPPSGSYLDARTAFTQSFDNLKSHQVRTYSAMQHALKALLAEFDPVEIEKSVSTDRSLADMLGLHKARLWDAYVSLWKGRTQSKKNAMLSAFMNYFAEHYDLEESRRDK
jgi:type VI secretion system protein ImpI